MTMQKYRKKPVVVEAIQWDGSMKCYTEILDWCTGHRLDALQRIRRHPNAGTPGCPGLHERGPHRFCDQKNCDWADYGSTLTIDTLEGQMTALPGDWIIRGVQGEFYPCKPDIFAATYEQES